MEIMGLSMKRKIKSLSLSTSKNFFFVFHIAPENIGIVDSLTLLKNILVWESLVLLICEAN